MPRDGTEIGRPSRGVRRKRDSHLSTPKDAMPASAHIDQDPGLDREQRATQVMTPSGPTPAAPPIADVETHQRRRRTKNTLTPKDIMSAVAPIGPDHSAGTGGDGQSDIDTHMSAAISEPIEPVATPVRKRRARPSVTPNEAVPGVSPIGQDASSDREQRAKTGTAPSDTSPAAPPIGHNSNAVFGGDDHSMSDAQDDRAISTTMASLVEWQRRRKFAITEKGRSERATEHLIANELGYSLTDDEDDRKKAFKRAKAFRLSVEKAGEKRLRDVVGDSNSRMVLADIVLKAAVSRSPWDETKKAAEDELAKIAVSLPVYEFAKSVKGFGDRSLGILAAEAAIPMGDYKTVSALWKRMGLAVIGPKEQWQYDGEKWVRVGTPARDDKRQQKCTDPTEALIHGYRPRRRGEVFTCLSDSMFRQQWCGEHQAYRKKFAEHAAAQADFETLCAEKQIEPSKAKLDDIKEIADRYAITAEPHPIGPYGVVYLNRRIRTAPRIAETADLDIKDTKKWTPMRCHNDACRVMSKALLRDLWRVWNGMLPRYASEVGENS